MVYVYVFYKVILEIVSILGRIIFIGDINWDESCDFFFWGRNINDLFGYCDFLGVICVYFCWI